MILRVAISSQCRLLLYPFSLVAMEVFVTLEYRFVASLQMLHILSYIEIVKSNRRWKLRSKVSVAQSMMAHCVNGS